MQKNKPLYLAALILIAASCYTACTPVNSNRPVEIEMPKPLIEPANPYTAVDKSPMDIAYYPVNYPMQKMSGNDSSSLIARVIYSRPQKNGRTIFGKEPAPKSVQQYGAYWRLGANEATEIEFFKPVSIGGKKIPQGRYIMYCIPYEDHWTIVLNSNLFSWGLHTDPSKDIAKTDIPATKTDKLIESFTMLFQQADTGANLIMAWDDVKAVLPIRF